MVAPNRISGHIERISGHAKKFSGHTIQQVLQSHATLTQSLCFRPPGRHLFAVTYKILSPKDDVNMKKEDHFVRLDNEKAPKAITFLC